jgi:hypothetical protein
VNTPDEVSSAIRDAPASCAVTSAAISTAGDTADAVPGVAVAVTDGLELMC